VLGLRTRNRELLLPLLLLPISLPALLGMVEATTGVLTAQLDPLEINTWITQLAGYDLVFTIVCVLLFETVLNAE
jgi:heme exporter protein B